MAEVRIVLMGDYATLIWVPVKREEPAPAPAPAPRLTMADGDYW
jgi:hypothetical protein